MDQLKQNFNNIKDSAKEQIDKLSQKPSETANDAMKKGQDQASSAADNARSNISKAMGKGGDSGPQE
ncbi:hypothetical protein BDV25DRAFT_163007 [Aspergillus avenaceus]|uniref:Uncharacterized protein n=1 Tax=Aspergillus avenaceus TaxID=36643 RepID=A0A5N6TIL2_ASPAV|nr:hypothetical protein BDV25DRAFT_163007 [Aspergillus avenaceus]